MPNEFRFGIIGAGVISAWHATGIEAHPEGKIVAISDVVRSSAEKFAVEHKCEVVDDWHDLVKRDDIHAICVCTPSGLHAGQGITAAEAGKHVLVEKPMAVNLPDAAKMIKTACENNVKLGVIFQLRCEEGIQKIRKGIENGSFGKLVFGDLSSKYWRNQAYYDSGAWRGTWAMDGGGCSMNQGIHGIDLLIYVMGDVEKVYAKVDTVARDIEVEDIGIAVLTFKNGAYGRLQTATAVNPGQGNYIEINGTLGTAMFDGKNLTKWAVSSDPEELAEDQPVDVEKKEFSAASSSTSFDTKGHIIQVANFIASVRGREELICDGRDGMRSLHLILGMYESARRSEEIVLDEMLAGLEVRAFTGDG